MFQSSYAADGVKHSEVFRSHIPAIFHQYVQSIFLTCCCLSLRQGQANPLVESLSTDLRLNKLLAVDAIRELLQADSYVGDAPERARQLAAEISDKLPVA